MEVGDQTQWALSTCPVIFGGRPGGVFLFDRPLPLSFSHRPPAVPADASQGCAHLAQTFTENAPQAAVAQHSAETVLIAGSSSLRSNQLKTKLLRPFGQRSDLLLAISGFIVCGPFVRVLLSVFDEPVE